MMPDLSLNDGSIAIRPFQPGDAQAVYDAIQESLTEVRAWLRDLGSVRSVAEVGAFIALQPENWSKGVAYNFVITDYEESTILGGCGLSQVNQNHRFANLFYWVRSSRTGKGIATEATRLLARYGLERLNLVRIEIVVEANNYASLRVAETSRGFARRRAAQPDLCAWSPKLCGDVFFNPGGFWNICGWPKGKLKRTNSTTATTEAYRCVAEKLFQDTSAVWSIHALPGGKLQLGVDKLLVA